MAINDSQSEADARPCPVCKGRANRVLFPQRFMAISDASLMSGYDVVPAVGSIRLPDGRMQSAPLHMMSPTLSKEQMSRELADDEIGEESPELVMSKR